ncbi:MAG: hypothetical protein RL266_2868 [Bacteroidota bacterium]|jgi:uncharacterized YigZ family protein
MPDRFQTILTRTESIFKDRGSRFLGYAIPIKNVDEIRQELEAIRQLHPSARHVCYAYILGSSTETYRANDDGEPNGTAGLPILNQIRSKEVTNVLVAVVRYFGGTKLGVSGLINAYKEAAKLALDSSTVIITVMKASIRLRFPHSSIRDVERTIRQNDYEISEQHFGMDCNWTILVPESELAKCKALFESVRDVQLL